MPVLVYFRESAPPILFCLLLFQTSALPVLPGLPALADCLRWLPAKLSVQLHWRPARLLHTGQAQPITRSHFCRNQSKAKFTNFARRGVLNLREKETWQSKNKFETEEKHLHGKGKVMLQILIYKRTEWFFDQALKRRHWTWWVRRILVRQQPLLHPATKRVHNHFYCNLATTETAAFGKYGPGP